MAGKITDLSAASTPTGAELIEVVQGGTNKKLTLSALISALSVGPPSSGYAYVQELIDTTPDAFTFTDVTGATTTTDYFSNAITVTGINSAAAISITGGTYAINGGSYTASAGTVNPFDSVVVKVTSSGSASTAVNAALTIGGVSDTYTVTTAAAAVTATWDPAVKSPTMTLSGGNLIATVGADKDGVRGTVSKTTGKFYCELAVGNSDMMFGVGNASENVTDNTGYPGDSAGTAIIAYGQPGGEGIYKGGSIVHALGVYGYGNVVSMAVDVGARLIWFKIQAGNWNDDAAANPATGAGGVDFSSITGAIWPVFQVWTAFTVGTSHTINFGATAYTYTAPSGFGNWI